MAGLEPPKHITASLLFRLLIRAPRARLPVALHLAGASRGAFFVSALSPQDEADAYDVADEADESRRQSVIESEFIARSLYYDGERAFECAADMDSTLDEGEAAQVLPVVAAALNTISPSYRTADTPLWKAALRKGCEDYRNFQRAATMAKCVDGDLLSGAPRPDRYFGVPMHEVTDGQWLAWHAARGELLDQIKRYKAAR